MRLCLAMLTLIACTGQAFADCAGQTQRDLDTCAGNAFVAADTKLNTAYQTIIGRLKENPAARAKLVAAQRAWIAFRDAECRFSASAAEGGTIQPMIEAECRTALTRKRQIELSAYLNCQEGDLSCPVPQP